VTEIEVFADVCCPFTHVGLRRLIDHRQALGRVTPRLLIRAWPLELVNGMSLDPDLIAEEVEDLRDQVAPDLFGGFDPSAFPRTSIPAFALAAVAYQRGLATGEAVSLGLRDALFEQGRNVAEPDVLAEIAAEHHVALPTGDPIGHAMADWREGQSRGVVGSPHFFVGGTSMFCPVLDIHQVDGRRHISVDEATAREFFERALEV